MIQKLNDQTDLSEKFRVQEEKEWRQSLKVGDYIDAVNNYNTPQNIHEISGI